MTIVGELQAPGAASTDPGSSEYPIVNIRDMTVWDKDKKGRFMAIDGNGAMKESGTLPKDTLVTVIGEVRARVEAPLDESRYQYPAIVIQDMTAWEKQPSITHSPPGAPLQGFRPFIFWDSRRVAGTEER